MNPIILSEDRSTKEDLENLVAKEKVYKTLDVYKLQLRELFEIRNPNLIKTPEFETRLNSFITERMKGKHVGNWVFFPWDGYLIHTLNENEYFELRTNRNRDLINTDEQKKLMNFNVGVVGLSVGSNIATGLVYQGISNNMKLAEFDTLETTNLNRIRAGIKDLHEKKLDLTATQIYEINPYANLQLYENGLTKDNLESFLKKDFTPNLIFEIIDNFEMKILLRLKAREMGIPVIMMANLGDGILIDIERFDLNKKTPLFNGVIGDLPEKILDNPDEDVNKYAVQIVGKENIPERAMESVIEIGKTLVGRPQLSSTVTVAGGIATYLARKIALKQLNWGERRMIKFDEIFNV
jgi:molybdopterin/thiamine biosynthesis adenylyltransferase